MEVIAYQSGPRAKVRSSGHTRKSSHAMGFLSPDDEFLLFAIA
jgi:hypothetical protein